MFFRQLRLQRIEYTLEEGRLTDGDRRRVNGFIDGSGCDGDEGDEPVGYALVTHFFLGGVEIDVLFVKPEYRGRGIEEQLIEACKAWWPDVSMEYAELECTESLGI